jgi:cytoskeletal protein CcmA (bactofilin family)
MNEHDPQYTPDNLPEGSADAGGHEIDAALPVDMGRALPPAQHERLPLLNPGLQALEGGDGCPSSAIADGMHFQGMAQLRGPCSISGEVEGLILQAEGSQVSVVVTETGRVTGDITAHRISVRGAVEGTLDAGAGEVSLHDGAQVQGKVRYGRIQVNGADLNATLERVVPPKAG